MAQFRFHLHTWSPADGHQDRRIKIRGNDMESALAKLIRTLEARETGVIINARYFETI